MASPVADTYSASSGASVFAGRYGYGMRGAALLGSLSAGGGMAMLVSELGGQAVLGGVTVGGALMGTFTPNWLTGSVGEWQQIAGTTAPSELGQYCGLAWREDSTGVEMASLASGGHGGNYYDNSVKALQLNTDAPSWALSRGASDSTGLVTASPPNSYFPSDGRPVPRHTYWYNHWVPELNRYMMFGCRFVGSSASDFSVRDGFNPDANDWDAAGTYSGALYMTVRDPATGTFYSLQSQSKFTPSTGAITGMSLSGVAASKVKRGGTAFDTLRNTLYHLSTGDNFSVGGSTANSVQITTSGACTEVTFNSSAGLTDFLANGVNFRTSETVYNSDLDVFYFYNGYAGQAEKIYTITPNAGTVWDMSLMTVTGGTPSASRGASGAAGVCSKFRYIQKYKALVLAVPGQDVYFLRTST